MSYLDQAHDPRRRTAALAVTTAVHAAIGLALVTGLTVVGYKVSDEYKPIIDIPIDPPAPAPTPTPTASTDPLVTPPAVAPKPLVEFPTPQLPPREEFDPNKLILPDVPRTLDPGPAIQPDPPRPAFTARGARPANNPGGWLSNDDYPAIALRAEAEGLASYRLIVGTNGRVSACDVTRSTGNSALDEATCKFIVRRARFEAATDESGAKVVGNYAGTVRWDIPD